MVGPGPDMTTFPSHPRAHEASRVYTATVLYVVSLQNNLLLGPRWSLLTVPG